MKHKEAIRTWVLIYIVVALIIAGAFIGRPKYDTNKNINQPEKAQIKE